MERFDLRLNKGYKGTYHGPIFNAAFDGACAGCSSGIFAGDEVRYIGNKLCHTNCNPSELDEYDRNLRNSSANHNVGYTISGARKPKVCHDCHIAHAGKPGEDCM